jgi:RNA-splicing ligase RtcB
MLADTVTVADKIETAYKELDESIKKIKEAEKDTNVIDFTQRRLAKR